MNKKSFIDTIDDETLAEMIDKTLKYEKNPNVGNTKFMLFRMIPAVAVIALVIGLANLFPAILKSTAPIDNGTPGALASLTDIASSTEINQLNEKEFELFLPQVIEKSFFKNRVLPAVSDENDKKTLELYYRTTVNLSMLPYSVEHIIDGIISVYTFVDDAEELYMLDHWEISDREINELLAILREAGFTGNDMMRMYVNAGATVIEEDEEKFNEFITSLWFIEKSFYEDRVLPAVSKLSERETEMFVAYYRLFDPSAPGLTDLEIKEMLTIYPYTKVAPVYMFDPGATKPEIRRILYVLDKAGVSRSEFLQMQKNLEDEYRKIEEEERLSHEDYINYPATEGVSVVGHYGIAAYVNGEPVYSIIYDDSQENIWESNQLRMLIDMKLVAQEAKRRNITLDDDEISEVNEYVLQLKNLFDNAETIDENSVEAKQFLERILTDTWMTIEEYYEYAENFYTENMIATKFIKMLYEEEVANGTVFADIDEYDKWTIIKEKLVEELFDKAEIIYCD